jgi:hypothetical protein
MQTTKKLPIGALKKQSPVVDLNRDCIATMAAPTDAISLLNSQKGGFDFSLVSYVLCQFSLCFVLHFFGVHRGREAIQEGERFVLGLSKRVCFSFLCV